MSGSGGLRLGLGGLPRLTGARTRSVSAENPTGEKGKGAMAVPALDDPSLPFAAPAAHLGRGWKANPFVRPGPGETVTLMDVEGPGVIQHIWIGTEPRYGRSTILRFYWDGEEEPSVEVPLGDFFAVCHELFAPVNSLPVVANAAYGLNCYWPMPFSRRARITATNDLSEPMSLLAYQVTYAETKVDDRLGRFHAQWRRADTDRDNAVYTILDGVRGEGHYVGTILAWTQLSSHWFGEGEVKFYLDGDDEFPTICGTGTEDYFGAAFGFPELYSTPFLGNTLDWPSREPYVYDRRTFDPFRQLAAQHPGPQKSTLYRWHVLDPVCFAQDIRVTIHALGWYPGHRFQPLADDVASVAYWYQVEPHAPFPTLPALDRRWTR